VCDPSEDTPFAYRVNGILVSDFYTPNYFDPVASPSVRYSFTGAIKAPRQVLKGGYISWHDPISDEWFQETFFSGTKPRFRSLGKLTAKQGENLRAMLYYRTPERYSVRKLEGESLQLAQTTMSSFKGTANAKAKSLRARVKQVIATAKKRKEKEKQQ